MSFTMFMAWVVMGVLAGVLAGFFVKRGGYGLKKDLMLGLAGSIGLSWALRAAGVFSETGIVVSALMAFVGAVIPIAIQRKFWPTDRLGLEKGDMWWRWGLGGAMVAVVGWMAFGPAQQPPATAAVIEDRTYTVTPASVTVRAGIVSGELTAMKITERVEKGSDRVTTPARLSGVLKVKNTSANETVRLLDGKVRYIDAQGQPIALEDARTDPTLKFTSYGSERLDPGQEATQSLDLEFPAEALKAKRLKEIRLDLAYIPSPYREETVQFAVSVGGQ